MSDEVSLLKAIRAIPDDDLPRLVYADWLDEQRRPELAEFIRTQIAIFRHPPVRPLLRFNWVHLAEKKRNVLDLATPAGEVLSGHLTFRNNSLSPDDAHRLRNTKVDWRAGSLWSGTAIVSSIEFPVIRNDMPDIGWTRASAGVVEVNSGSAGSGPQDEHSCSVRLIPVQDAEDHSKLRAELSRMREREQELWDAPQVRGYYNRIYPYTTVSSQVVIAPWEKVEEPQSYLVGRIVRGMVEEIRIPVNGWLSRVSARCHITPHKVEPDGFSEQCHLCPVMGKLLLDDHPITTVIPADKHPYNPYHAGEGYRRNLLGEVHWYDIEERTRRGLNPETSSHPESDLPRRVYNALTGGEPSGNGFRVYKNAKDAYADVSRALITSLTRTTTHPTS